MIHWRTDNEHATELITAKSPKPHSPDIVACWVEFYRRHGQFPPILMTEDGDIVNGNHRVAAARLLGVRLWASIVVHLDGGWMATGCAVMVE